MFQSFFKALFQKQPAQPAQPGGLKEAIQANNKASFDGMLTGSDLSYILGELQLSTLDIGKDEFENQEHFIVTSVAKNKHMVTYPDGTKAEIRGIEAEIREVFKQYQKPNFKKKTTIHVPLSNGSHWTLGSVTFEEVEGEIKITRIQYHDSLGGPSKSSFIFSNNPAAYKLKLDKILQECELNWFSSNCSFEHINCNAQSGNLYCGDYTIKKALELSGYKIGDIAVDKSQDLSHGGLLRQASTHIVSTRLSAETALKEANPAVSIGELRAKAHEALTPSKHNEDDKKIAVATALSYPETVLFIPPVVQLSMAKPVVTPKPPGNICSTHLGSRPSGFTINLGENTSSDLDTLEVALILGGSFVVISLIFVSGGLVALYIFAPQVLSAGLLVLASEFSAAAAGVSSIFTALGTNIYCFAMAHELVVATGVGMAIGWGYMTWLENSSQSDESASDRYTKPSHSSSQ